MLLRCFHDYYVRIYLFMLLLSIFMLLQATLSSSSDSYDDKEKELKKVRNAIK